MLVSLVRNYIRELFKTKIHKEHKSMLRQINRDLLVLIRTSSHKDEIIKLIYKVYVITTKISIGWNLRTWK